MPNITLKIAEDRTLELIDKLQNLWEQSVSATHSFLTEQDIIFLRGYVADALKNIAVLVVAYGESLEPIGFMGIDEKKLEMLFISPAESAKGVGKQLLIFGIENYFINELSVNEQNPKARGFYEHMGFKVYKRTELDEQGNNFPLLYMELAEK